MTRTGDQGLPRVSDSVTGSGLTELWQRQLELAETEPEEGRHQTRGQRVTSPGPTQLAPAPARSV